MMTLTRIILGSILGSVDSQIKAVVQGDAECVKAHGIAAKCDYHGQSYSYCYTSADQNYWHGYSMCHKEEPGYRNTKDGTDCVKFEGTPAKCGYARDREVGEAIRNEKEALEAYKGGSKTEPWCYTDLDGTIGQCHHYHVSSGEGCVPGTCYDRSSNTNTLCTAVDPSALSLHNTIPCKIPDVQYDKYKRVEVPNAMDMEQADQHCKANFKPVNTWSLGLRPEEVIKWVTLDPKTHEVLLNHRSDFMCWNWNPAETQPKAP